MVETVFEIVPSSLIVELDQSVLLGTNKYDPGLGWEIANSNCHLLD